MKIKTKYFDIEDATPQDVIILLRNIDIIRPKEQEKEEEKEEVQKARVKVSERGKKKKKYVSKAEWHQRFMDTYKYYKQGMAFSPAFRKATGLGSVGGLLGKFNHWLRLQHKKGKPGFEKIEISKGWGKRKKIVRKEKDDKSWNKFRSTNITSVIQDLGKERFDALRYLANIWKRNNKDYDKAIKDLEHEIKNKGQVQQKTKVFPKFETDFQVDLFKNLMENVKMTPDFILRKNLEGMMIGVKASQWRQFVREFMRKSQQVSDSCGIPNRFKVNDRYEITYEG